jgi:hypothetical protein
VNLKEQQERRKELEMQKRGLEKEIMVSDSDFCSSCRESE